MVVASSGFRWIDLLEKELDKAVVDLDLIFGELDEEESQLVKIARQRLASVASCFSQLTHKAQTVFQTNAKLEAELIHLRAEVSAAEAARKGAEVALEEAVRQLHSALLQVHSLQDDHVDDQTADSIRLKLATDLGRKHEEKINEAELASQVSLLQSENQRWKMYATSLHSDIYGSRLAAKYLEKELAGRIQQMQLLGREMRPDLRDKLWDQLEAEIHLHRHKVIIRACHNHNQKKRNVSVPLPSDIEEQKRKVVNKPIIHQHPPSEIRTILIRKGPDEGLGMSITGGRDHGVPVVVSELHPEGPATSCGQLNVGDAIVAVNGIDLKQVLHEEAVRIISSQQGDVELRVQFISPSLADSEDEDVQHFQYEFFNDRDEDEASSTASQPTSK